MLKKVLPVLTFVLLMFGVFDLAAQEAQNVTSKIEGKSVIVSYDLVGDNPEAICEVKIYFGNATSQNNLLVNAAGDFGANVKMGPGKQVTISDLTPLIPYQANLSFRVEAAYSFNPPVGTLAITTSPADAMIYLNDELIDNANKVFTNFDAGTYRLKIMKDGYVDIEKEIEVLDGETTTITETLTPGYEVTINSTPQNADLVINGENAGVTPTSVILQPGSNTIGLSAEDYDAFSTEINPSKKDEVFTFTLIKAGIKKAGNPVLVGTYPKKTNIKIDGNTYTDKDTLWVVGATMKIIVEKDKFKTFDGSLDVKNQGQVQKYDILLEPLQYRTKGTATIYSLLLPGMGQYYLKRGGWTPAMGLLGYGLLAGSVSMYNSASASYELYLDENEIDTRAELKQQWQDEKNQSEMLLYGAVAVWVGNLVWTLLSDDEATRYQRMKTEIKYDNATNSGSVGLLYQFGGRHKNRADNL